MSIQIGVKDLHIALMTTEDTILQNATYASPIAVPGAMEVGFEPSGTNTVIYADDGSYEVISGNGPTKVSLSIAELGNYVYSLLMGNSYNSASDSLVAKSTDTKPYFALGFKSVKADGNYRFVWLYKGKAMPPKESYKTKKDSAEANTPTLEIEFIDRKYDKHNFAKWDEPTFTGGATFFNTVVEFTSDSVAPTVTSVPVDGATGVNVASDVVWTFNESIKSSLVTSSNFMLIKATTGAVVAGALAVSTVTNTNDTVTFNPTSNLDASSAYIAIANSNVEDLAGNNLAANNVVNFTTT